MDVKKNYILRNDVSEKVQCLTFVLKGPWQSQGRLRLQRDWVAKFGVILTVRLRGWGVFLAVQVFWGVQEAKKVLPEANAFNVGSCWTKAHRGQLIQDPKFRLNISWCTKLHHLLANVLVKWSCLFVSNHSTIYFYIKEKYKCDTIIFFFYKRKVQMR